MREVNESRKTCGGRGTHTSARIRRWMKERWRAAPVELPLCVSRLTKLPLPLRARLTVGNLIGRGFVYREGLLCHPSQQ